MRESDTYDNNLGTGILFQGQFATGKSSLGLKLPNVYVFDADNNLGGAIRYIKELGIKFHYDIGTRRPHSDPEVLKADPHAEEEVPEAERYDWMGKCLTKAFLSPAIKSVYIDGASGVSDFLIAKLFADTGKTEMTIPLWGVYLETWKKFITKCRSQKKLFAMSVHEEWVKSDNEGVLLWEIMLPGKISSKLGSFMSDVWRHEMVPDPKDPKNTIYGVRTRSNTKVKCRCSFPGMPALWDGSNMKILYKALNLPVPEWYKPDVPK